MGRLDAEETLCLNLMTGRVSAFAFSAGGESCILSTLAGPRRRVRIDEGGVTVETTIRLVAEDSADREALDRIGAAVADSVWALIQRCQELGVEPFGFAERAAVRFPTCDAWAAYNWRERFKGAKARVTVMIAGAGG